MDLRGNLGWDVGFGLVVAVVVILLLFAVAVLDVSNSRQKGGRFAEERSRERWCFGKVGIRGSGPEGDFEVLRKEAVLRS